MNQIFDLALLMIANFNSHEIMIDGTKIQGLGVAYEKLLCTC